MTQLVYIAGPYRNDDDAIRDENVHRACVLGHYACQCGLLPVVPHALAVSVFLLDEALAQQWCKAMSSFVGASYGSIWIIEKDDGSLSEGTAMELTAFRRTLGGAKAVHRKTWAGWEEMMRDGRRP